MPRRARVLRTDRLTQLRKKAGLSQQELADRIHTSQKQIAAYENESDDFGADPSAAVLLALALELNTSVDYLLGASDAPPHHTSGMDLSDTERDLVTFFRRKDLRRLLGLIGDHF